MTLVFPSALAAQRGLSIGPKVGLSISRVRGDDAEQVDARNRVAAGVVTSLALGERLAVEVHGVYTEKGGTMTGTSSFNGTIEYRFDYIEVPVLLRYKVRRGRRLSPGLVLGIAPAFRLNSTQTSGSFSGLAWPRQFVLPKATDVGLVLGVTVGMPAGRHQVRLDASYTLGLKRLAGTGFTGTFPSQTPVQNPDVDLKNSALIVTVGYAFNVAPRFLARGP
jgi:hypothetical protein